MNSWEPMPSNAKEQSFYAKLCTAVEEGHWAEVQRLLKAFGFRPASEIPVESAELVLDLLFWKSFFEPHRQGNFSDSDLWTHKLQKLLAVVPRFLEEKTYPLASIVALVCPMPRSFRKGASRRAWKKHFRRLRRLVPQGKYPLAETDVRCRAFTAGALLTFRDAAALWRPAFGNRLLGFRRGRVLRIGRLLYAYRSQARAGVRSKDRPKAPRAGRAYGEVRRPERIGNTAWGTLGHRGGRFLNALIEATAVELVAVRRLATAVSFGRRRVVLSLHNASAAACSGWAFETVECWSRDEPCALAFLREISKELAGSRVPPGCGLRGDRVDQLWQAWQERLVRPKAVHVLWEARAREGLGAHETFHDAVESFHELFSESYVDRLIHDAPFAWTGWLSPHQQLHWRALLHWWKERKRLWHRGFLCLKTFLAHAQAWMDAGRIDAFVIPWIDKFFISSRREQDWAYLAMLLEWLREENLSPIILLWEDTTRAHAPSLATTLRKYWSPDAFTGFGVFGDGRWTRQDAEGILPSTAKPDRLYVLRPLDDTHSPRSVEAVLCGVLNADEFFTPYDSSWKDGAYAFYAGTQIEPLTSIATEPDTVPAWVVTGGVRRPLGWFFRRALQQRVLERDGGEFSRHGWVRFYTRFANLL